MHVYCERERIVGDYMGCHDAKCRPARYFVPYFAGWTEFTPTIPSMYWNTYSQEERIHRISALIDKISCYCDMLGDKISVNRKDIDYLLSEFVEFKEQGFDDYYAVQVAQWIADNLEYIYNHTIKQVWFGLTLDGHFVAYIPDSWNDIQFDTGYDYDLETYGRLILRWNADSEREVNQTPEPQDNGISG